MHGGIAEEKCIFQVLFLFLSRTKKKKKKNVLVIFYVGNPQTSIKINFKFLNTSYHWIPVGYCYSSQYIFIATQCQRAPVLTQIRDHDTDRKNLETLCVLVTFKLSHIRKSPSLHNQGSLVYWTKMA